MKKYKYLLLAGLLLTGVSCQEEFLEEDPYFLSPNNFYQNEADALSGLTSVYDLLNGAFGVWGDGYTYGLFLMADGPEVYTYKGGAPISNFTWTPETPVINGTWSHLYKSIAFANTVIGRTEAMEDFDNKNRILAEAQFLRAFFYFHLVSLFENVPLVLDETSSLGDIYPSNEATTEDVWQLIEDDAAFAEVNLPDSYTGSDLGRVTKGAAMTLLAKSYLQQKDWASAAEKTRQIINSGMYSLYEDVMSNWATDRENETGMERIFELQYTSGGINEGSVFAWYTTPWGLFDQPAGGWQEFRGHPQYYDLFPEGERKDAYWLREYVDKFNDNVLVTYPSDAFKWPVITKYIEYGLNSESEGEKNFIIYRYADVLLMNSEAENMLNGPTAEAVSGINMVRERAGLDPILPGAMGQEELRRAIINERIFELHFEGHSYYDFTRQGVLEEMAALLGYTADQSRYRYPIPQGELDVNENLVQNTGY